MLASLGVDLTALIVKDDYSMCVDLAQVSKSLEETIRAIYSVHHRTLSGTKVVLQFHQALLRDCFLPMQNGTFIYRAVKSSGKTYAGYAAMNGCGLVLATTDSTRVWVNHAEDIGWYNPDPEKSKVLCISDCARHKKYANEFTGSALLGDKIIIAKDCHLDLGVNLLTWMATSKPKVLVVDEANVVRSKVREAQGYCKWYRKDGVFDKQLLLSADIMNPERVIGCSKYIRKSVFVKHREKVPEIVWHVELQKSELQEIVYKLACEHTKVAVVSTSPSLEEVAFYGIQVSNQGEKVNRVVNKEFRGFKLFYQKHGKSTIPKFNRYAGKAILLLNTAQNRSNNIHARAVIVPDAGRINTDRVTQTVGRVARTGNDIENVHAYLYASDEQEFLRCHYARCFYSETKIFVFDTLPNHQYLRKCVSILKLLGVSICEVNQVDGCIVFADTLYINNPLLVLNWWLRNRTVDSILTEDMVCDMLCM